MGRDFCNETELRAVVSLFQLKKDLDIKQLYTYLCPVIIFVCFFSIIFNAILMSISRQSKAVNKSPILLLSLNLALTDLIASLFNGLGILFNSYLPEVFDRKMPPCAMLTFEVIRCAALIASALHLLALAFVHYRGIVNPLHYRSTIFFSQHLSRSVNVISVCCWIIPLTIMVVWFSSTPCQGFQTAQCDYLFLTQFNFRYMMLTVFSVPLLLMSAIYIRIFLIINRHQKGRRLQHEQSALVCGVVNATAGVSGTAASVNLSELMMAGRVGGPATTGGTGSDGHDGSKTTNGRWQADKQEQAADRCPVCSGHKAPADYYTSENEDDDDGQEEEDDDDDDDEDEDDNDDLDEAADGDEDSGNNDQEDEENCDRRRQHRRARRNQSGISALCESERAADAAGARAGERALLICTATEAEAAVAAAVHDERTRANKSKTQDGDDVTRMATDGDPSSVGLITLEHIPLADDRSSVAATLRTKGVSGQQSRRRSSDVSREAAAGGRGGDSLRDESAGGGGVSLAGRECDMNLNNKQGQSLDGDAGHRRRAARRLRRERRKLHLVCSASLSSSSRGAVGQSSQSSSDQNNNPEENPAPLGPLGRGGGGAKRCTCDNKLKPAAAPSQRTVKLARANTIGFTAAAASETDEPVASMGAASLRILRQPNGRQPALTKTATVVTVAAGDAGSSISTCTAADSRAARSRPTPLRLQLRRSPTSPPEAAAAAAASDAGSAHSSVRASSYALKRARSTKIDAAAAALDATSVSATTMTSGIPAANRSFGWPGSAKNNFGAWVTSERTASANSSVHNQRHHEPQRRHVHASAVPQTNTKALVTTLLILGTYVVSYVPAIAWHALTCIDSVVCPFPLYGIPYGWRVLFGSMTTLLLIAKSIVDPLIYSYRMNEIQVALSRYLSKRRSKSSSHATSLHTSQRFTFNAGGGGNGGGMGETTTYQTNAGGNNSSFKILTNSHSSLRYKNKHNNNFAISTRPSPLAATPTLAKPDDDDDETVGACESQPLDAVTNRNVSAKLANNVIALDHEQKPPAQMIELVRVDQTNDLTCAQQLTRQEQGAAPIVARTQAKSLKFDEELTGTRSGNSIKDSIPKTTTEPNSIVVNLQQPKQRLDTRHSGHKLENNATASANGARGDLVC